MLKSTLRSALALLAASMLAGPAAATTLSGLSIGNG